MERFVQAIVAGGIALVAGLWLVELFEWWSLAWLAGVVLAVVGTGSVFAGIFSELESELVRGSE
ncbi:hypothetical protein [Natronobacterium texcoconense]|uniref:Uncharacterized protein n=1 Tax=Natronobacterium texcoconense TaxID=1095778 RepID=A0A1H1IAL8_NATTX|nr:hypothetical protein [Natronobacterium texcoconense]SDR34775.1 hypothetical protein SAMN04489842_3374 [Natronobacterium texcoconense]